MCTGTAVEILPHRTVRPLMEGPKMAPLIVRFFFKTSRKLVLRYSGGPDRAETNYHEQVERGLDDNYAAAITSDVWTAGILLAQQHIKTSLITFRMFAHQHSRLSERWWGLFHIKVDTNVKRATMAVKAKVFILYNHTS